jgi:hypothetical protein
VAADMEKARFGYLASRYLVIDVLPAPEGAVMIMILFAALIAAKKWKIPEKKKITPSFSRNPVVYEILHFTNPRIPSE